MRCESAGTHTHGGEAHTTIPACQHPSSHAPPRDDKYLCARRAAASGARANTHRDTGCSASKGRVCLTTQRAYGMSNSQTPSPWSSASPHHNIFETSILSGKSNFGAFSPFSAALAKIESSIIFLSPAVSVTSRSASAAMRRSDL